LLDVSVSEVFKTYNGYEVNKDETITLVQRSGYLQVDLKSFFEGYGAKVTLDNYQYTIEGLETGGDSKTGYYELFLQKDKEYVYQTELDTRLPILEEKEFLVMITYDEEEGRNFINYVCPVETSNYKSLSIYKDFNFSTQMDNFLTDFYNAFIGE